MEMAVFFVMAVVAVVAGIGVVAQRSAVRSALFLLVNFCCLAGLYILLNAQFLAMVQLIVYAGAVVVLFLFVVMLLGVERAEEKPDPRRWQWVAGVLLATLLLAGILWALMPLWAGEPRPYVMAGETMSAAGQLDNAQSSVRAIGAALLTDLIIPFEMVSVVLLVAIIGAVVLAKKRHQPRSDA